MDSTTSSAPRYTTCGHCRRPMPYTSEFFHATKSGNLRRCCKECKRRYDSDAAKARRNARREKRIAHQGEYYHTHREEIAGQTKARREGPQRDEILAQKRAYYAAHREEISRRRKDRRYGPRRDELLSKKREQNRRERNRDPEAYYLYHRAYYLAHREKWQRDAKKRMTLWRDRKARCVEYKGGRCERCGYDHCHAALEFHHRDPSQKEFIVSNAGTRRITARVQTELDKCELLCANCHREAHYDLDGDAGEDH